jgi:hypothetical protein
MIKLICLASLNTQVAIVNLLQQLVGPVSIIDPKCWLDGLINDPNSLCILVLPETEIDTDKIVKAITASANSFYLAIFSYQ